MKVMVIVKATADSEAGKMPSETLLAEMGKYNEDLVKAGVMLAGEGLHPSSNGYRVQFSGKERTVLDGPFAETKELIAGFWLWRVESMDEAIRWVKKCPNPMTTDSEIEIRQVFEADDFGESLTPELREQEASLRAQTLGLGTPRFEDGSRKIIAGINETYTFETRANIPAQWGRFAPSIGNVPTQVGPDSYGVCWNYQPGCGFDYLTGVEVTETTNLPSDFTNVSIPAQRYVVFTHHDHVSKLPQTLDAIWSKWLPDSGFRPAASPSFERYTKDFDPKAGKGGTEIWVPIRT